MSSEFYSSLLCLGQFVHPDVSRFENCHEFGMGRRNQNVSNGLRVYTVRKRQSNSKSHLLAVLLLVIVERASCCKRRERGRENQLHLIHQILPLGSLGARETFPDEHSILMKACQTYNNLRTTDVLPPTKRKQASSDTDQPNPVRVKKNSTGEARSVDVSHHHRSDKR
jgi:hypothetical protein